MDFGKNITIRRLFEDERPAALDLAWRVFSEHGAGRRRAWNDKDVYPPLTEEREEKI